MSDQIVARLWALAKAKRRTEARWQRADGHWYEHGPNGKIVRVKGEVAPATHAPPRGAPTTSVATLSPDPSTLRYYLDAVEHHGRPPTVSEAFESGDFGRRSEPRIRAILRNMHQRANVAPGALNALMAWRRSGQMDHTDRAIVSHWHAVLSDPLYHDFTTQFVADRALMGRPVTIHAARRWMAERDPQLDQGAANRKASALLTAARHVGLVNRKGETRALPMSRHALAYGVHLARARGEDYLASPMFASSGHHDEYMAYKVRKSPDFNFRAMAGVRDLDPKHAGLAEWAASFAREGTVTT